MFTLGVYFTVHFTIRFSSPFEVIYGAADPICLPCPGHRPGEKPARGLSLSLLLCHL